MIYLRGRGTTEAESPSILSLVHTFPPLRSNYTLALARLIMNQESTDPPSLLHNQFVDVGIFDYGIECTHRPPSRMIFLGHRTLEDDNRLGYREQAWGLRTIVDLTADPAKHFVACQRTDSDLVVARPRSSNEMLCSNGVKFCWIGLRNTAYAKRVLRRISWWDHWYVRLVDKWALLHY